MEGEYFERDYGERLFDSVEELCEFLMWSNPAHVQITSGNRLTPEGKLSQCYHLVYQNAES